MTTPPRRILLVDADAFFVAVARQVDPEGAGKATLLIVGGSAQSRGVVCSASYEVRKFGVRSGMPIQRAIRLCPQATCVPVPRHACSDRSRAIAAVLQRWTPVVQASSIDEWYLDLGGTEALYDEPLAATARRIRDAVREATGLSVSIGCGTNKLVAKVAVEVAKPGAGGDGVHAVPPGAEVEFMRRFELRDLPFVGPRLAERLARNGLRTVPDALAWDEPALVGLLGERTGRWIHAWVRGIDDRPVASRDVQKGMSREDTFPRDLHTEEELERELLRLSGKVAADLRGDGLRARTITVKVRDADFVTRQAARTLDTAVESDRAVATVARELLRRLRKTRRVGVRLLGVALSGFGEAAAPDQLALFDGEAAGGEAPEPPVETERDRRLSHTLDALRGRFGRDVIMPAALRERPSREPGAHRSSVPRVPRGEGPE
ncbi:DNA polymerase IV [Roseisolibacter sp. H3M3-2]|uniref:Y-family DNA polymerase n=1 Tax=Roseisolibacter sp. H3M3-2 TaxID=3031323 RepID=UPI0023D9C3C3|nr:DNA polymerase IV [Roseisolibacter sp. H3M3-2]MDF1503899.1 DNA polymerase IV [Roseisolibacter sp. H3M3-2]